MRRTGDTRGDSAGESVSAVAALSKRQDLGLSSDVREKLAERVAVIAGLHVHEEAKNAYRAGKIVRAVALGLGHAIVWKAAWEKVKRTLLRHD